MENKAITVSKTVSDKLPADYAVISVSATAEAKKYAEAVEKAEALADGAVAALKKIGLGNGVRSVGVRVHAVRSERKITGYRATRSYTIGFDLDKAKLGEAFDALSLAECEYSVSYSLKDKTAAAEELLARAVKAARQDAQVIASAAGVKLGGLCSVDYSSTEGGHPVMMRAAAYGMDGCANDAEPQEISISESVTCSFSIA